MDLNVHVQKHLLPFHAECFFQLHLCHTWEGLKALDGLGECVWSVGLLWFDIHQVSPYISTQAANAFWARGGLSLPGDLAKLHLGVRPVAHRIVGQRRVVPLRGFGMPRQGFHGQPDLMPIGPSQGVGVECNKPRVERCPPCALDLGRQKVLGIAQQILRKRQSFLKRQLKVIRTKARGFEVPRDACHVPTSAQDDMQFKGRSTLHLLPTGLNISLQPSCQMQSILKGPRVLELGLNRWETLGFQSGFLAQQLFAQ